jgi:hypothetical protein
VWGRFPYDEAPGKPALDCHPCLVLGWNEFQPSRFSVLIVFGTSNTKRVDAAYNFQVSKWTAMREAGLNKVTLFDLGRWKWLQWHKDWFETPDPKRWSTPVIGRIGADGAAVLRYQLELRAQNGMPTPPRPKPQIVASNPSPGEKPGG